MAIEAFVFLNAKYVEPEWMNAKTLTIQYPLPPKIRHLGGRLQRKVRLRKKQQKYRLANGYSFRGDAIIENVSYTEEDGVTVCNCSFTFVR